MSSLHTAKQYIDKKLITKLRLFFGIVFVMVLVVLYQVLVYDIAFLIPILCLIGGLCIGLIVGRMYKISWNHDANVIVARVDKIGAIILVCYIALAIARKQFLEHWTQGHTLLVATLAITIGTMIGRIYTIHYSIKKLLQQMMPNIFKK